MSASSRYSSHADNKKANGPMAGDRTSSRMPRINTENPARIQQKTDIRSPVSGPEKLMHKRALSGMTRTNSMRSTEERERRTEKHTVTTRDSAIHRIKSPDKRSAPTERGGANDGRRSADTRSKEQRQEVPAQGMHNTVNVHSIKKNNAS